ncbi:MAG TPA: hypothetical protein VG897_14030 [Terriglobales bacterium]|nr:hypothetical protein [Terriglobales bacterium]
MTAVRYEKSWKSTKIYIQQVLLSPKKLKMFDGIRRYVTITFAAVRQFRSE